MKLKDLVEVSEKDIKLKDLKNLTRNLSLDWVHIINDQLLKSDFVTDEDEMLLYSPGLLQSYLSWFDEIDSA